MRKAELIKDPAVPIPRGVKGKNKGVILTGRAFLTRDGLVLETDFYLRGKLVFRHFTSKTDYCTLNIRLNEWTEESISWLNGSYQLDNRYPDLEAGDYREEVSRLFNIHTWMAHAYGEVEIAEREIRWDRAERRSKRKFKRIQEEQENLIPTLPKDFRRFVVQCADKEKEGAVFGIQLYQEAKDGTFVERQFRVRKEGGLTITEECRGYSGGVGFIWNMWRYGCRTGIYGTDQIFWDRKGGSAVHGCLMRRFYLYTKNLSGLGVNVSMIKKLQKIEEKAEWSSIIRKVEAEGRLVFFYRAGLTKLVSECMAGCRAGISTDPSQKRIDRYLGIKPQQLAYLKEANGGWRSILFLQADTQMKLRTKDLLLIERVVGTYSFQAWLQVFERGLSLCHVAKLLTGGKKRAKKLDVVKYCDYLDMAEERGSDVHDEIIYRNRRWQEYHDRYTEELNERRRALEVEKAKAIKDHFKGIRRDYKMNCQIFQWEGGGYCIEVPRSFQDIVREGQEQHHCVGASDRYMAKMAARESFILFLRKQEDRKNPYYTIEADLNHIIQAYGAYDRKPDWDIVKPVLDQWMKQVKKNARELEEEKR